MKAKVQKYAYKGWKQKGYRKNRIQACLQYFIKIFTQNVVPGLLITNWHKLPLFSSASLDDFLLCHFWWLFLETSETPFPSFHLSLHFRLNAFLKACMTCRHLWELLSSKAPHISDCTYYSCILSFSYQNNSRHKNGRLDEMNLKADGSLQLQFPVRSWRFLKKSRR